MDKCLIREREERKVAWKRNKIDVACTSLNLYFTNGAYKNWQQRQKKKLARYDANESHHLTLLQR
jgi:hypothetical protein